MRLLNDADQRYDSVQGFAPLLRGSGRRVSFSELGTDAVRLVQGEPEAKRRRETQTEFGGAGRNAVVLVVGLFCGLHPAVARAQQTQSNANPDAVYRQQGAPIERRVEDLLSRMTLEEKARQLDLYSGATALMDKHYDDTHATADAVFVPNKAQALLGSLGVGGVHDLYATAAQSNAIQSWVIAHNRLGIPALFIEEALHGFDTGTVFPAPINLAATWNREMARQTGAAIAAEARATGVDMILAPVSGPCARSALGTR